MNSAKLLKSITKSNNALTLKLQKMSDANTAKTFKFNAVEAGKQRAFNQAEATVARDWQKMMSDTSHQREVKDLKAAGLNPVLSANSGAQSYTTSAATSSAASGMADASSVGALAQLQGSQNSARASIYGSDASLRASQSMASAQRYAADRSYQAALASAAAARYSADKHLEAQKYAIDNRQVNTGWAAVDKAFHYAQRNGVDTSELKSSSLSIRKRAENNPTSVFSAGSFNKDGKLNKSFVLTPDARMDIESLLRRHGVKADYNNVMSYVRGFIFGYSSDLARLMPQFIASGVSKASRSQRKSTLRANK